MHAATKFIASVADLVNIIFLYEGALINFDTLTLESSNFLVSFELNSYTPL